MIRRPVLQRSILIQVRQKISCACNLLRCSWLSRRFHSSRALSLIDFPQTLYIFLKSFTVELRHKFGGSLLRSNAELVAAEIERVAASLLFCIYFICACPNEV